MTDLHLKFPTEAEALAALFNEDDQPRYAMSIDIIGTIYKPAGVMLDADTPEMAAVDGWHVNTRGEAPEELLPYSINPTQPVRVWA